MLYEINGVKSYKDEPLRKWFFDHDIDLTVWFDDLDEIIGWQLVYDKPQDPHALTWFKESGFRHNQVDDGERHGAGVYKGIPILLPDGEINLNRLLDIFREKSKDIDSNVSNFVINCLKEIYTGTQ